MAGESMSRRYVGALFAVAHEQGVEEPVLAALRGLGAVYRDLPQVRQVLANPRLPEDRKLAVLTRLTGDEAPPLMAQFLALIVRKRRLEVLRSADAVFADMLSEARGVRDAEVVTALPLSPDQVRRIADALRRALGHETVLHLRTDPGVVGGVAVRVGDLLLDGSLRQRLESLRKHFAREREMAERGVAGA